MDPTKSNRVFSRKIARTVYFKEGSNPVHPIGLIGWIFSLKRFFTKKNPTSSPRSGSKSVEALKTWNFTLQNRAGWPDWAGLLGWARFSVSTLSTVLTKSSVFEPRKKNILLEKDEISEENWSTLELEMTFNEEKTNCSSPNLFVAKESY